MTGSVPLPILVAVGDSDEHDAALVWAAAEATREGRYLLLAHVVHPIRGYAGIGPESVLITLEAAEEASRMLLERAARRVHELTKGLVRVEPIIRRGETVEVLVALSEVADRVVLQHRQLPRLERIFTGSVAAGVAGRSAAPVISVPEQWRSGSRPPRITVGVADSSKDRRLLETAFATASAWQGTLTLLNAWFLPSIYDDAIVSATALHEWTLEGKADIERLAAGFLKDYPSICPRVQIKHMRPADALVEASRHSDLIMLGRSRSGHRFPHLGSLTRAIIRESLCPVEVIPIQESAKDEGRDAANTAAGA